MRNVPASTVARCWARVRPQRMSSLLIPVGEDPDDCLIEEIPVEGFGDWRHALHVLCFLLREPFSWPIAPTEKLMGV
jgi:hypothetical protein